MQPNHLDLPSELQHLIEKRENERRREGDRRTDGESDEGLPEERREGQRRTRARRQED